MEYIDRSGSERTNRVSGGRIVQHIVVDEQQARLIAEATESIEIRDLHGRHLGYVAHGFTAEDFSVARQRLASDAPRRTTREVLDHLRSIESR